MLRLLVLLLVLANALYFAWSDGLLRAYGMGPTLQREPQRLEQQIHPEAIRVLSSAEVQRVEAQALAELAPKECLQAGPFDDAQTVVLRRGLEGGLAGATAWQIEPVALPPPWMVYMGKFATAELLARKRAELAAKGVTARTLGNAAQEFGLSLGNFETQALAAAELARLVERGVRSARVVQETPAPATHLLKLPAVSVAAKAQLEELKPLLAGKALIRCN